MDRKRRLMENNNGWPLRNQLFDGAPFRLPLLSTAVPASAATGTTAAFTRATTGSVQDHEGVLRTAIAGEARFTGARRVRNLMVASENFTGAAWTEGRATLSANSTTAPNGTTTATTITSNSALASSHFLIDDNTLVPNGDFRLYSVYVKPSTHNYVALNIQGSVGNYVTKVFDLANGVVGETLVGGTSGALSTSSITPVGNGWFRISMLAKITSAGTRNFVVFFASAATGNTINTTGDISIASTTGTEAFYIWGAQVEDVTAQTTQTAGEYVSVGVLSAPYHGAGVDGVKYFDTDLSGNPLTTLKGYLAEGARTNLCLQSNSFDTTWTASPAPTIAQDAVGPDGGTTAWTLTDASGAAAAKIYQAITLTAAAYTTSIFVKKTTGAQSSYPVLIWYPTSVATDMAAFTVDTSSGVITNWTAYTGFTMASGISSSVENYNDDFWRCSFTKTGTAADHYMMLFPAGTTNATQSTGSEDATAQGSAVFYGAQVELGSFASSYIATTTVAVTRNADVLTYSSAGNIDGTKGWCYAEVAANWSASPTDPKAIAAFQSSIDYGLWYLTSANNLMLTDGAAAAGAEKSFTILPTAQKVAATWSSAANSSLGAAQGVVGSADTFGAEFTPDQIGVGIYRNGTVSGEVHWFGTIRNVRIGQRQLSASELQAITR